MATVEEFKGDTPAGGDRMEAYFTDADGKPVDKKDAKRVEIVEYKGDEVINRVYGEINT